MARVQISDLPVQATAEADNQIPIDDTGVTKRLAVSAITAIPAAELALHVGDPTDAHDASAISFTPTGTVAATDVQAAIAEVATEAANAVTSVNGETGAVALIASEIPFTPTGSIAATDVQAAIAEVAAEAGGGGGAVTSVNGETGVVSLIASEIPFTPTGTIAATNVQTAIAETSGDVTTVATDLSNHINDGVDAHDASAISFTPASGIAATDVQAAIVEAVGDAVATAGASLTNHLNDAVDAHDASAISFAPTGTVAATDVQAAVAEVSGDVTTVATDLSNHLSDATDAHDASAISFSPTGSIAATDVQAAIAEVATEAVVAAASETVSGRVELATAAETLTGTDNTRAVHPAGAFATFAPKNVILNAQTGTTYTLVLADAAKLVTLSNAAAIALTVPTNASVAFPVGTSIVLQQLGAGQVTVGGGGITFQSTPTLKTRAQFSVIQLIKVATDTWIVAGDLAAT